MDASRPQDGGAAPSRPQGALRVLPPLLIESGRAAVVLVLIGAGVVLRVHHRSAAASVVPLVAAGVWATVIAYLRVRPLPAVTTWGASAGLVVAGLALGSVGHPEVAVAVAIVAGYVAAAEAVGPGTGAGPKPDEPRVLLAGGLPVVAALGAGLAGAALRSDLHPSGALVALMLAGVGGWAAWAGRAAACAAWFADAERAELSRLRTEMVTTVSHELRTPLTVIQGATATLTRRWDILTEPERLDLIDVLTENVASLDASILHFVDAARLERGGVVLKQEWVDVAAAVSAAASRRNAALAGHEIRQELAVGVIWADRTSLERMLEHLLMNAARFSSIGLPITVRATGTSDEAVISVVDRGQGIAPHLQQLIWEPLRRGDVAETGVSRGAGLGLPIVRELARLHGGDATLASVKGRGTTVTIRLPQPAAPAPALQQPSRQRGQRAAARRRAG